MIRSLLYGAIFVALVAFWAWSVIDVAATARPAVRNLPKVVWLLVVIVTPPVGGVVWLLLGRPEGVGLGPGGRGGSGYAPPRAPGGGGGPRLRSPRRPEPPRPEPDRVVTDRRSAELDRRLDEWLAQQAASEGDDAPASGDVPDAEGEGPK